MHLRQSRFILLLPVFFLTACAGQLPHESLPDAAQDKISSTEVVLPIQQSEIYVFVPNSNVSAAAGGGLLAALVDIGINDMRTSKAEDAVKPLRDALVDYNFDETMRSEVKASLSTVPWMHIGDARIIKEVTSDSLDRALTGSKAGVVLFVTTDYNLSNDADTLSMTIAASLFPNDDALKALKRNSGSGPKTAIPNSLYHNTLAFKAKLPNRTNNRDSNIVAWSADKAAAMRAALKLGAAKLAMMLTADLQGQEKAVTTPDPKDPDFMKVDRLPGQIINRDDDGVTVGFGDGTLKYVAKLAL